MQVRLIHALTSLLYRFSKLFSKALKQRITVLIVVSALLSSIFFISYSLPDPIPICKPPPNCPPNTPPTCPPPICPTPPPIDPKTETKSFFYEFCSLEEVHRLDLHPYNLSWYIVAVDDRFYADNITLYSFTEDFDMPMRNMKEGRINLYPERWESIVVEIYDKAGNNFLACKTALEVENVVITCPLPKNMTKDVESIFIRLQNGSSTDFAYKRLDLCKAYVPQTLANLSVCVAYVHNVPGLESRLIEFIEYHRMLGVTNFIFYDRTPNYKPFLSSLYPPSVVTHVTWPGLAQNLTTLYTKYLGFYDQIVALNHCLFHTRRRSKWVSMFDLDEYIMIPDGRNILEVIEENDRLQPKLGTLTLEQLNFKGRKFDPSRLVIEQYRDAEPTHSHHKFLCKPNITQGVSVHYAIVDPYERTFLSGDNVNFSTPRFNHYMNLYEERYPPQNGNNTQIMIYIDVMKQRIQKRLAEKNLYSVDLLR